MFFLLCGRAYALFIWNNLSIQVRLCYHIKFSLYIKLKSVISSVCVVHIFISNMLALIKILCLNCCLLLNKEISANNNCQSSPAFITTSYSQLTMSPFYQMTLPVLSMEFYLILRYIISTVEEESSQVRLLSKTLFKMMILDCIHIPILYLERKMSHVGIKLLQQIIFGIWKWTSCQVDCKKFLIKAGSIKKTTLMFDSYSIKLTMY